MQGRYVIQEHATANGGVHWDLMLEDGERLLTWRLESGPEAIRDEPSKAVKIDDHPLRFITYEGPVQQGTGRVRLADAGTYEGQGTEELFIIHLRGKILRGTFRLERQDEAWTLRRGC